MKKICYVIGDLDMGGWPTFLINLATELKGQFEFSFVALDNPNINPKFDELGEAFYVGNNPVHLENHLLNYKPDLVQFGNKNLGKLIKSTGVPIVIERTAGPRSCNNDRTHVDYVVASNNGTIPLIRKNYDGPLSVIYNGMNLDRMKDVKPDRLRFGKKDFVVCYCARMGGVGQGFQDLISAALMIRKKQRVKLVLIGDKPESSAENIVPRLKDMAKHLGDDCVFTGALDNPLPIIAGCDLYVCPARHHGISNAILEACALGRPVVATDVGQTNEIVHQGKNGYLVQAQNVGSIAYAMAKLYGSPKKRKMFGEYSKKLIKEEFNIKAQARRYADLYTNLFNGAL